MLSNKITRFDDQKKLIGELEWEERPGSTYEMHLDVIPEYHRRGIGRSMFEELETLVKSKHGMSIYSFCAGDNNAARSFFLYMGFIAYKIPNFYGEGRDAYFLVKTVGKPR